MTHRRRHDITYVRQPFNPWMGCGFIALGFILGIVAVFVWVAAGLALLI